MTVAPDRVQMSWLNKIADARDTDKFVVVFPQHSRDMWLVLEDGEALLDYHCRELTAMISVGWIGFDHAGELFVTGEGQAMRRGGSR